MSHHCDGCDQDEHDVREYVVTYHDGETESVRYCGACAEDAAADWNCETASIRCASEGGAA